MPYPDSDSARRAAGVGPRVRARDAGLRKVSLITCAVAGGGVALTGGFAVLAAHASTPTRSSAVVPAGNASPAPAVGDDDEGSDDGPAVAPTTAAQRPGSTTPTTTTPARPTRRRTTTGGLQQAPTRPRTTSRPPATVSGGS